MKRLLTLFVLAAAAHSLAQEEITSEALKKMPPLPLKEESLGNAAALAGVVVAIDEAFAIQNQNEPPKAPFTIVIPTGKNLSFLPGGKKSGNPELLKLLKATADKHNVEMLRLASLVVPLNSDLADRLKICAHLLKTQALALLAKEYKDVRVLDTYATKVSGNDAVCLIAQATSATGDTYAVKLAGILHPTLNAAVLASLVADTKLSEVKRPEDLASKGLGLGIIHSVRFVDPHPVAKP
jgi:hypothetical protein